MSLAILISIMFQYILYFLVHSRHNTCSQHNVISVFSAEYPERVLKYYAWRLGHKSVTNSVHNLQYGPRTRLVRGICRLPEKFSRPCVTMTNFAFYFLSIFRLFYLLVRKHFVEVDLKFTENRVYSSQ